MTRLAWMMSLCVLSMGGGLSSAQAQEPPDGPIAQLSSTPPAQAAGTIAAPLPTPEGPPSAAAATRASAEGSTLTGVVGEASRQSQPSRPPRTSPAPGRIPPSSMRVAPNVNTRFSIALYHVNRIITPFREPEIQTSSTAGIAIDRGIINIVADREDPIGLFIYDRTDPSNALSLTLTPTEIPPVSVTLNLEGWEPARDQAYARTGNPGAARQWETDEPYIATLKELFKGLALGKVPEGYGFVPLRGNHPLMPRCNIPGIRIEPLQLLEGYSVHAIVARATNLTSGPVEINENGCSSTQLLAVAAWPSTQLWPGQAVELYLAIRAPSDEGGTTDRPLVIGTGR